MNTRRGLMILTLLGTTACGVHGEMKLEDGGPPLTGVLQQNIRGPSNCAQPPDVDGGTVAAVVAGNSKLALQLFGQLAAANAGQNIFLSPYSVSTAMTMAYEGADTTTATQMAQILDYPALGNKELAAGFGALACQIEANGLAPDGGQVDVANAVFGQTGETFEQPFTTTLETEFGAPFTPVEFATDPDGVRQEINKWVSNQTDSMIPQLLSPGSIDSSMRLVLVDALYFNENWETPFDPATTGAFHVNAQTTVQVPLMTDAVLDARYYSDATVTMAEIPFQNGNEAIDFLLPGTGGGTLADLDAALTAPKLQGWFAGLTKTSVLVTIPKFKVDWASNLIPAFQALGLALPFDSTQADFSGIDGAKDLFISLLQHEAVLTVQESGVTAAAATAVGIAGNAAPQWNETFSATQPFIVVLRDVPTGTLLFIGQVTNPSGS